jgi:hypothetical protein
MKKGLFILSIALGFTVQAQNLQLFELTSGLPAAASYTFNVPVGSSTFVYEFAVKNSSGASLSTKVRKVTLAAATGQNLYFCNGSTCYPPTTNVSANAVSIGGGQEIPNGTGTYGIRTDFDNGSVASMAIVRYRIYDVSNTSDSASVTIYYNVTTAGINTFSNKIFVSDAVPNPASDVVGLTYNLNGAMANEASVKIFNAIGTLVKTIPVNATKSNMQVDVSDLQEGFYFYSIMADGRVSSTRKFIIER